jgi:hypothetical protein
MLVFPVCSYVGNANSNNVRTTRFLLTPVRRQMASIR